MLVLYIVLIVEYDSLHVCHYLSKTEVLKKLKRYRRVNA